MFKRKYILKKSLIKEYNLSRENQNVGKPICLAPFKSLRFLPDGNITVCCHNNSFTLGTYPASSILEAWNSKQKTLLQGKLSNADFTLGCQDCFPAFQNQQFSSVNPLLYENYSEKDDFPVMLDFKSATECNLECVMCSEYSSSAIRKCNSSIPPDYESPYDDKFVEELYKIIPHVKEARFSGGEPFLNNIYYKIWDAILEINPECKMSIQTNGTILNTRIKSLLERGNFSINVSIDAISADLYSKIRKNGDLNTVLENIEYFSDYSKRNNLDFGITACAMQDNALEFVGICKLANKYNAKLWYSDVTFPLVNALWVMKSEDLFEISKLLKSQDVIGEDDTSKNNKIVLVDLIRRIDFLAEEAVIREKNTGSFISPKKQADNLKAIFKESIISSPEIWSKIEDAILSHSSNKMVDISEKVKTYYNSDFVFQQLGQMKKEELVRNFGMLVIS